MKLIHHTLTYLSIAFFLVIGVWAIVFYVNFLDEIYDSIDDGLENSKILIIQRMRMDSVTDRTNLLESHYAVKEISPESALNFRDIYKDSTFYMVNESDYEPVRVLKSAFRSLDGKYYELQVFSSMVEEDDLIEDLLYSLIWLYVVLLASILLINRILLKRIWRPFYDTIERLKGFAVDRSERISFATSRVTEFKTLNEAITALLERTRATFNSQKQFIENASHELQTPLAISINKLELLAEKNAESDSLLQEISPIIQSLERLARLNKTLLLLARIENRDFAEVSSVDVNELMRQIVADHSDLSDFKNVFVSIHEEAPMKIQMNPGLASIMISNLLKNAILHNVKGGNVDITIKESKIMFENTGRTTALDGENVFKRFHKDTASESSTGLGLAIVKSIADYYDFAIDYEFTGKHVFTVSVSIKSDG